MFGKTLTKSYHVFVGPVKVFWRAGIIPNKKLGQPHAKRIKPHGYSVRNEILCDLGLLQEAMALNRRVPNWRLVVASRAVLGSRSRHLVCRQFDCYSARHRTARGVLVGLFGRCSRDDLRATANCAATTRWRGGVARPRSPLSPEHLAPKGTLQIRIGPELKCSDRQFQYVCSDRCWSRGQI